MYHFTIQSEVKALDHCFSIFERKHSRSTGSTRGTRGSKGRVVGAREEYGGAPRKQGDSEATWRRKRKHHGAVEWRSKFMPALYPALIVYTDI